MNPYPYILVCDAALAKRIARGESLDTLVDIHDPIMGYVRGVCLARGWEVPKEPFISDLLVWVMQCYQDSTCMYNLAASHGIRLYEPVAQTTIETEAPLFAALRRHVNRR